MRGIIIQSAHGYPEYLLDITEPVHRSYCERAEISYLTHRGRIFLPESTSNESEPRAPNWDKIPLLCFGIAAFDVVIWMDADTLIVNKNIDIVESIIDDPHEGVFMAKHKGCGWKDWPDWHYNTGVMIFKVTKHKTKDLMITMLKNAYMRGPGLQENGIWWQDQAGILDEIQTGNYPVETMTDRLNSTVNVNEVNDPIIKAWHGMETIVAQELMKKELENVIY